MDFIKGTEQVKIDPNGIEISGTSNILLKSDGKVGIGTNNPQHPLQVNGSQAIFSNTPELLLFKEYGPGRLGPTLDWGSTEHTDWKIKAEESGLKFMSGINNNTNESISISNTGTIDISGDVSLNGDLSLNGDIVISGNVGIGITDPVEKLDIDGNILIKSTTSENTAKLIIENPKNLDGTNEKKIGSIEFAGDINHRYTGSGPVLALGSEIACVTDFPSGGSDADQSRYSLVFKTRQRDKTDGTVYDDVTEAMRITGAGYVGISTSEPEFPLTIDKRIDFGAGGNDYVVTYYGAGGFNWNAAAGSGYAPTGDSYIWGTGGAGIGYSALFKAALATPSVQLFSDRRIKTDISLVDDDIALNQINSLETYEYNYIDPERRRPTKTIGFIAQEVKEIIPNASSIIKQYIPDEMRIITDPQWTEDAGKYYLNIPDLDMSGAFTGKVKFYVSNDPSGNDEVCKEVEIEPDKKTFVFDQSWNNVFLYGKEVTDFHTIDKAQIFALHHSAIQELDRKHKREVEEKDNKISTLEHKVDSLTARLEALESSVLSLQNN